MFSKLIFILLASQFPSAFQDLCGDSVVGSGVIVGGSTIKRGQWPFVAALFLTSNNQYFCGGTIISSRHVITVAHCMSQKFWDKILKPEELFVYLGKYNITKHDENESEIRNVSEIIIHPDWNVNTLNYDADLAILKLSDEITKSNFIKIACWPTDVKSQIGEGVVIGWGASRNTDYTGAETIAKQTVLAAVSNEFCFLHKSELTLLSSNRTFCAGGEGVGPCHGDSGMGFFIKAESNWFLRGIVSSSLFDNDGKCDVTRYAVFTNVVKHTDWVQKVLEGKFVRRKFEYLRVDKETGKKFEVYSYRTNYYHLNGSSEGASSTSFKEV